MKYGLPKAAVEKICAVFARFPEIEKAVLYGSRAKGNFKTGSDIDLTLYGEAVTSMLRSAVASELDDLLLPYTIDLSVFDELDHAKLREHIERVGVLFYERANRGATMKKGWPVKKLGEVSAINYGYTESASSEPIGPHFLRITDIQDDHVDWENVPYCKINPSDLPRYRLASGDIVFARTGATTGKSFLVYDPPEAVFASYLIRLRLLEKRLLPEFVSLFFQTDRYWKSIQEGSTGSAQGGFNATKLGALTIPVPPLPEQHRIVGILDEAFAGIATAKANAEKNLQNARALFDSHLQFVFLKGGKGWKQRTLEEIATTFGRGKSKHRPRNAPHLYGGKYPFVQTGDIRNADHLITEHSQTYSEVGLAQSKLWPKGTICITIAANIAETAILGFDACFPDSVIGVVANPKEADVGFIEYLLQSFKARLQAMGKGSAQANINMGTFENERFPFPAVSEQKQIVVALDSLREETQRLETIYRQKLAALDELKKSLLHQAFAGEL